MGAAPSPITQVQQSLDRGEPLLAYNAAREALDAKPGDPALERALALALARSGDAEGAHERLSRLAAAGHRDAETLGLLARTHKDLALAARDEATRSRHLGAAFDLCMDAFGPALREGRHADAGYTGINAATLAVLRGDPARAREIAARVREACDRDPGDDADAGARYWREATLAEAALILGDAAEAADRYRAAAALSIGRYGQRATTRRQALLLGERLPGARAAIEALDVPPVVVYTGHMMDAPGRANARFPAGLEAPVAEALRARLADIGPLAAYGSAACGADLLCLEAADALGIETHVVLPFPPAEFRRASVDFAGGDWGERFERALQRASTVTVTSDHRASGSSAPFEYSNLVQTGMAQLRATMLDTSVRALAAWNPSAGSAAGGSASLVAHWQRLGLPIEHVPVPSDSAPTATAGATQAPPPEGAFRHELRAMLFADAVGYSKLDEDQIPRYVSGFLGAVARLNERTRHRHEHVEVAGDGLYMVFGDVEDAGRYALELRAVAREFDRAAWGLPASFDLRIALHCGPVHCGIDPITGGRIYTGPHTSRTARIEPITPPGQVYASSAFAAVAAARGARGLDFRYAGRIPLAKGYGTLGLYHVRAAGPG